MLVARRDPKEFTWCPRCSYPLGAHFDTIEGRSRARGCGYATLITDKFYALSGKKYKKPGG